MLITLIITCCLGSRDSALALWRINDDVVEDASKDKGPPDSVRYAHIQPVQIETCKEAEKIRALAYSNARMVSLLSPANG